MRVHSVFSCGVFVVLAAGMLGCVVDRAALPDQRGVGDGGGPGGSSDGVERDGWEGAFGELEESGELDEPGPLVLVEGEREYRLMEGGDGLVTVRVEQVDDAEYPYRRYTADDRIEHLRMGEDASVLIGRVEDLDHDQTTSYDPPVPLLPGAIRVGEPVVVESSMTVRPRGNSETVTTRGRSTITITLEGVQGVRVGGEEMEAHRVTTAYEAKLGMATVTQTTTDWWVEGFGLAAEESAENIGALIFNSKTERKMIAVE